MQKVPFAAKICARALSRLDTRGFTEAVQYATQVAAQNPRSAESLLQEIAKTKIEPFSTVVAATVKSNLTAKNQKLKDAQQRYSTNIEIAKLDKRDIYLADFLSAERSGQAIVFLASIDPTARKLLGTTQQRREAIELRKSCIRSTALKAELACTDTELKRWSTDGRLPVLFYRRMSGNGITLDVRHWSPEVIAQAKPQIDSWREEDKAARKKPKKAIS